MHNHHGTVLSYTGAALLSLFFTGIAYALVTRSLAEGPLLVALVVLCGVAQFVIQMVYFLHLSPRKDGRWNLVTAEVDAYMHKQN
jgi:cytochrome o ubiquinol oxidase subunit IV